MTRPKKTVRASTSLLLPLLAALLLAPLLCGPATAEPSSKSEKVAFNFVDVELPVVVKFVSEVTGKNFIFDESLKGKVTIIAPTELSNDDAFRLFSAILELKGYTLLPSGVNAYKIVHQAKAKQGSTPLRTGKPPVHPDETFVARLIPLNYVSARDAQNFLKPLISKTGHLSFFGPGNMLLAVDSELNIQKLQTIIEAIDQPSRTPGFELVPLQHASAENVAGTITSAFSKAKPGQPGAAKGVATEEAISVVPDERMNAVILIGDNKARKDQIRKLIELLDQPLPEASSRTRVYFLEYADAEEISKVIGGITKTKSGRPAPRKGTQPGSPVLLGAFSGEVTVVPHKPTNSLVVNAAPADYMNVVEVIRQLDRRTRQVFIEAVIAEVSLQKIQDLGTKWRATVKANDSPVLIGGVGEISSDTIGDIITGIKGLSLGGMGDFFTTQITDPSDGSTSTIRVPGFAALIKVQELRDAFDILSAPNILTSDNTEAKIHVGQNVPFISKQETTAAATTSNIIERADVGIQLNVTPQINEGDYISLKIYQEESSVLGGQSEEILTTIGPAISKRSAETSVVVRDGESVVIAGLMREQDFETVEKVPILGDIPLLGWFFKFRSTTRDKVNLLISITPRIVRGAEDLREITDEKRKQYREQVGKPDETPDETKTDSP